MNDIESWENAVILNVRTGCGQQSVLGKRSSAATSAFGVLCGFFLRFCSVAVLFGMCLFGDCFVRCLFCSTSGVGDDARSVTPPVYVDIGDHWTKRL